MASGYGLTGGMLPTSCSPNSLFRLNAPHAVRLSELSLLTYLSGVSRCFPFWQEYLACYVVNQNENPRETKACVPVLEDYYECLHHRKEVMSKTSDSARWGQLLTPMSYNRPPVQEQCRKPIGKLRLHIQERMHQRRDRFEVWV